MMLLIEQGKCLFEKRFLLKKENRPTNAAFDYGLVVLQKQNFPSVVWITGAGAGIGLAVAKELLQKGCVVVASVRDINRAKKELAPLIEKYPETLRLIKIDVRHTKEVERGLALILKEFKTVHALINNAGYGIYGPLEELDVEQIREQMETNFFGAIHCMKAVLPVMRKNNKGKILNITSILGQIVIPTGSAYCASKWALNSVSETLRYETAPFGIDVTSIEPGLIQTSFKKNTEFVKLHHPEQSPYSYLHRKIQKEYSGYRTSPEKAAQKIVKILYKKKMATRYRIGADALFYGAVKKFFPESVTDRIYRTILNRYYKQENH